MKVMVTGGAGFIGERLIDTVLERGHTVTVLNHRPPRQKVAHVLVDLAGQLLPAELFEGVDAVIHLAGRNIFACWNDKVRKSIYDSRILSTRSLVSSIARLDRKPSVFVSASAVGIYGERGEEELDESSAPGGDFLARVCLDWEAEARKAEALGLRTAQVRTAPVLGHGGMLAQMLPLYRWGLGGPLGSGRQWFPWIHIQDIVGIYVFSIENKGVIGPINACAPGQVTNKQFSDALGKVLRRPAFMRVPQQAVRLVFDGLADFILASQKVVPRKAAAAGYQFAFPEISGALADLVGRTERVAR
ncbi:MAG: TIGR01777 family oxidoreductase [Dehalococcoidia bacterium]|nr:TIGR01777 family oxidoreductase [Dehalococcoidia bacterium]